MKSPIETLEYCPLCGNGQFDTLPTPGRWIGKDVFDFVKKRIGLNKCVHCSLVFNNPRPSAELLTRFYSKGDYTCHSQNYDSSINSTSLFIHKTMKRFVPSEPKLKLLDYGCGGGSFLINLIKLGWDGQGYEVGQAGIASCRSSGLKVTSDINELPKDYFNAVLLKNVFEHIPNPKQVLHSIASLLTKNGYIFIATPNKLSLRARLSAPFLSRYMNFDERHRAFPIHLFYYSHNTLPKMLKSAGYQVYETITYGMGIEELIVRENKAVTKSKNQSIAIGNDQGTSTNKIPNIIKKSLKDWFYRNHWGESVMVIAGYPK